MLELILVISMLSIVALLFISYTGDVGNVAVDAASWKIQADLRRAQQLATTTGQIHGAQFIRNSNYTVYRGTPVTPILDPLEKTSMVEDVTQYGNIRLNNNFQVEFDSMGRPTVGGGGYIEILADSGASRRVYVIENTGAVIVDVLNYGSGCSCDMCEVLK